MANMRVLISFLLCCMVMASTASTAIPADAPPRGLLIVVSSAADPTVQSAANAVLAATAHSPLLQVMNQQKSARLVSSEDLLAAKPQERAFNHLVLVGLPDDPIIQQAWQREARPITVDGAHGFYIFGWGNLLGDIGYIESNRNLFLHSSAIKKAPFETEIVTLTGSTPAAVKMAVDSFLRTGLINGVIAGKNWKRGETTILDRDPLPADFSLPDIFPTALNGWTRVGITAANEDEYRGVLADTGVEPAVIWRAKYFQPGAWDAAGAEGAFADFNAGLHRRSYGNTVWAAQFADAKQAVSAARKIAAAAHLKKVKDIWRGEQPPLGFEKQSGGPLELWFKDQWVFMSTLPYAADAQE